MKCIGGPLDGRDIPDMPPTKLVVPPHLHALYVKHEGCWVWREPLKEMAARKKVRDAQ